MSYTPTLRGLKDVTYISALASGQVLVYDGVDWKNNVLSLSDLNDIPAYPLGTGNYFLNYNQSSGTFTWETPMINIDVSSQGFVSWDNDTRTLTVDQISVGNVTVDDVSADLATYIGTGPSDVEGDIVVLTNTASGTLTYIHNGGSTGTTTDYTLISNPSGAISSFSVVSDSGPGLTIIDNTVLTITGTHGIEGITSAPTTVTIGFASSPTTGGTDVQVWAFDDNTDTYSWATLNDGFTISDASVTDQIPGGGTLTFATGGNIDAQILGPDTITIDWLVKPTSGGSTTQIMLFDDSTDLYSWADITTLTSTAFTGLTDTPNAYVAADTGKLITINGAADGLEFKTFTTNNVLFAGQNGEIAEDTGFTYTASTDTLRVTDANGITLDKTVSINPVQTSFVTLDNTLARNSSFVTIDTNKIVVADETPNAEIEIISGANGLTTSEGGPSLVFRGIGNHLFSRTAVSDLDPIGNIEFYDNLTRLGMIRAYRQTATQSRITFSTGSSIAGDLVMTLDQNKDVILHTYGSARDDSATTTPVNFIYSDVNGKLQTAPLTTIVGAPSGEVVGIRTVTADYTVVAATDEVILADATSNSVRVTLPDASTVTKRVFVVKALDVTNPVLVDAVSGNIDGVAVYTRFTSEDQGTTVSNTAIQMVSDGTNYYII